MSGPNSNPEIGQQDYRTPGALLEAIQRRLGIPYFSWDLACQEHNCVGREGGYMWPDMDALKEDWSLIAELGWAYCNPPFAQSSAFCRLASRTPGLRAVFVVPVAIGTHWWRQYVHNKAEVLGVGRMVFNLPDGTPVLGKNGKPQGINRDVAILVYGAAAHTTQGYYALEDWRTW
jgi:hypothetical protein